MYENTKNNLFQRYRNKQLMDEYERRKQYEAERQNRLSNGVGNTFKVLNGIDKAKQLFDKPYQPSAVGNAINFGNNANLSPVGNAINSNVMGNAGNIGSEVGNASSAAQGASTAGGASQALGTAGSALAVGLDAKNMADNGINFNNGTDMAADAASLGLMATGVGAPAAAAVQAAKFIKNMVTGAIEKKKQQAMQASMRGAAEEQEKSMNNLAEQQQAFEEQRQNNMANLQNQMQTMQQPQDNNALVQDILGQVTGNQDDGQITGGAAPLPVLQATQPVQEVEAPLPYEGSAQQRLDEIAAQKQSVMDALKSGFNDFSAGYQDNANTDFAHGDLMGKLGGGVQTQAPTQNEDGSFDLGAEENKKSIMARLGEIAGTGQRIAAHPLTHAAIAALVSKAAGGDIDDMAKAAFEYGSNKAQADRYYQQVTGKTNRPFLNSYSYQDVTNKRLEDAIEQKRQQWEANQKYKEEKDQRDYEYKAEKDKRDYDYKVNKDKEDRALRQREIAAREKYYATRGNNRSQQYDPTTNPDFYDDYERYSDFVNLEDNEDAYDNEVNDMLTEMYGNKWHYSQKERDEARAKVDGIIKQQKNDFYKKYRINPMKGKKV